MRDGVLDTEEEIGIETKNLLEKYEEDLRKAFSNLYGDGCVPEYVEILIHSKIGEMRTLLSFDPRLPLIRAKN